MTKADAVKLPSKVETVNLKVFIHCEGCRRKVKKIINSVDGVLSITIDSNLGKVTVTGSVDSKTLVQKLLKAGKHAEPWTSSSPAAVKVGNQPNQPKAGNNNINNSKEKDENKKTKEKAGEEVGEVETVVSNGGSKGDGVINAGTNAGGGKKGGGKKGGGGVEGAVFTGVGDANAIANKNMAQVSIQTGYSLQSAEYATHMFSDENANNCHIM